MMNVRLAESADLPALLDLYRHLHPSDAPLREPELAWERMLAHPGLSCIVVSTEGVLVSSCCLVIVPNLTRDGKPYALIDNVVTHANFRRRGFGRAAITRAMALAWEAGCYKAMLLSGSQRLETHQFYLQCGFRSDDKTGSWPGRRDPSEVTEVWSMALKVFIENEAGSSFKNHHNERTLTFERAESVACPYPFPYGFIIDTVAADGDCLDCFVITNRELHTGEIFKCEAIGVMEQIEEGLPDNNVLARLLDEQPTVTREVESVLGEFVRHVFSHLPDRRVSVGRFLSAAEALSEIEAATPP
jgi:inorganic pyrophosphatase/GNAT superfamily N-acetyltransferase